MKKFRKILLILILLPCMFIISGCSFFAKQDVYVTNILKTETVGTISTYTIYFSDGSTSTLTVTNGKDGKDGENVTTETVQALYELYLAEDPDLTFNEFLKNYFTVNQVTEQAKTIQSATNIALQSTVSVWCEFPTSDYRGANKDVSVGCGAGVIYKMDDTYSYIITNYHVIYYDGCDTDNYIAKEIHVFQYGTSETAYQLTSVDPETGKTSIAYDALGYPDITYGYGAVEATYVGGELTYDLAVLQVKTEDLLKYNEHAVPVTIAKDYEIGSTAIAIGNPSCEGTSVTSGIVSVVSEELEMTGADDKTKCEFRVMRIDTAINGGNSGGGLFNINGELLGIVNAKVVSSNIDNIAYALPNDNVTAVVDNLLYYYNGETPSQTKTLYLGIGYTTENSHSVYDVDENKTTIVDDLVIRSIASDSVADLMNFKVNDVVKSISINGNIHTINRSYQLNDLLLTIREGDKILIQVKRTGLSELQTLSLSDENGVKAEYLKTVEEISALQ